MADLNVVAIVIFLGFVGASLLITWWAASRTRSAGESRSRKGIRTSYRDVRHGAIPAAGSALLRAAFAVERSVVAADGAVPGRDCRRRAGR